MIFNDRANFDKQFNIRLPWQNPNADKLWDSKEYFVVAFGAIVYIDRGQITQQACIEMFCADLGGTLYKHSLPKSQQTSSAFTVKLLIPFANMGMIPIGAIFTASGGEIGQKTLHFKEMLDCSRFNFAITAGAQNVEYAPLNTDKIFDGYKNLIDTTLLYQHLSPEKQYYKLYFNDATHWLVITHNNVHYLMHPAMFLSAHYGASSEITRVLLNNNMWDNVVSAYNRDYRSQIPPQGVDPAHVVLIGDKQAIDDCVFLYHFKTEPEIEYKVRVLHNSIAIHFLRDHNQQRIYLPDVRPYHSGAVSLSVRGCQINAHEVLVTQIEMISEPDGPPIYYDIPVLNNQINEGVASFTRAKILGRNIRHNEVLMVAEQVNNLDVAIVRSGVTILNDTIRKKIRNREITRDDELYSSKAKYVIPRDAAEAFAAGDRLGDEGVVGFLRVVHGELMFGDFMGDVGPQYQHLMNSALAHTNVVQSYTFKDGLHEQGKTVPMAFKFRLSFPRSVLVLVLEIRHKKYVFIDCERDERHQCAGIALAWDDSWTDDEFKKVLRRLLGEVGDNYGSLSEEFRRELAKDGISIVTYNHTQTGDWVRTAVSKF